MSFIREHNGFIFEITKFDNMVLIEAGNDGYIDEMRMQEMRTEAMHYVATNVMSITHFEMNHDKNIAIGY